MVKKQALKPRNIKVQDEIWNKASKLAKAHYGLNTSELVRQLMVRFINDNRGKPIIHEKQSALEV